jgi:iron complex transport system permease protein
MAHVTIAPAIPIDRRLLAALGGVIALAIISLTIGVYDLSFASVLRRDEDFESAMVFVVSRVPRTIAIVLVGMSMSVAGMIMQLLARNRFVSPTTAGTSESAGLGILVVTLLAPGASLGVKMLVATVFALAGTALFLTILSRIPLRSPLIVPLVGIMLGGVVASVTTFFAYRYDLLQSLAAWTGGDFSRVLRGRYELLWLSGGLTLLAFLAADRFTVAGMGEAFSANLGLNYRRVLAFGLVIVSTVTAVNVITVGAIPVLGLIVPNVVRLVMGDNVRRAVPWVAVTGAAFLLACDIFGRVVRYPFEIPIGTVVGVVGSAVFLYLLLRESSRVG